MPSVFAENYVAVEPDTFELDETVRREVAGPPAPWAIVDRWAQDDPWDYYAQMEPEDLEFLNRSTEHTPCPWCGGRLVHAIACDELHDAWSIKMEFGKHKGRIMRSLPRDYLEWLAKAEFARHEVKREACRILGIEYIEKPQRITWGAMDEREDD